MSRHYKVVEFFQELSSMLRKDYHNPARFSMTDRWTEGGDAFKEAIEELKRTCSEDQEIKVVVLTRHGSASFEDGLIDPALTEEGVTDAKQAVAYAEQNNWLPREMTTFISCLTRTYETARILTEGTNCRILVVPSFREQVFCPRDYRSSKSKLFQVFEGLDWSLAGDMTEDDDYQDMYPVSSKKGGRVEPNSSVLNRTTRGLSDAFGATEGETYLRVVGHGNSFSTGVFKQLIYQGEMPYSEFVSRYPGFTEDSDRSEKLLATGETVVLTVRIQKTDEALPDFPVSDEGCSDRSDDGFE